MSRMAARSFEVAAFAPIVSTSITWGSTFLTCEFAARDRIWVFRCLVAQRARHLNQCAGDGRPPLTRGPHVVTHAGSRGGVCLRLLDAPYFSLLPVSLSRLFVLGQIDLREGLSQRPGSDLDNCDLQPVSPREDRAFVFVGRAKIIPEFLHGFSRRRLPNTKDQDIEHAVL